MMLYIIVAQGAENLPAPKVAGSYRSRNIVSPDLLSEM